MEAQESPSRKCAVPTVNQVSFSFSSVFASESGNQSQMASNQALDSSSLSVPCQDLLYVRPVSSPSPSILCSAAHITQIQVKEEIPEEVLKEEESVCRICFGVCEEGDTLRMECSCKGDLRLVHQECLVKWFNMKGNRMCDVCGNEVSNVTMTWLQQPIHIRRNNASSETNQQQLNFRKLSDWQEFVLLFIFSTLWYFCFLEMLLIQDLKAEVVIIYAASLSVILGLSSSILAFYLAMKEYVLKYVILEWGFVAIFLQIFYYVLHMEVIYVIILSSVLGFGMVIALNFLYIQYLTWRFNATASSVPA